MFNEEIIQETGVRGGQTTITTEEYAEICDSEKEKDPNVGSNVDELATSSNEIIQEDNQNCNILDETDTNEKPLYGVVLGEHTFDGEDKKIIEPEESELLKIFNDLEEELEDGVEYEATLEDVYSDYTFTTRQPKIVWKYKVYNGNTFITIYDDYIFSLKNPESIKATFKRQKRTLSKYGKVLSAETASDIQKMAIAFRCFIGTRVIIEQSSREEYKNYRIITTEMVEDI